MPRDAERIPALLLCLWLAMAVVLVAVALTPELTGGQAGVHPGHPTLLRSADGATRAAPVLALGWAFGALQLAFFAACFALGMRRREGLGRLRVPILLGLLAYQAVWAAIVWSYWRFAHDPAPALWLGFPAPTALVLYVLWPMPLFFAAIYLWRFDTWVLSDEDLARFRKRLAELRADAPED